MGNWEYQLNFNLKHLKKAYADAGIELLINDACEVHGLKIVGLDDLLRDFRREETRQVGRRLALGGKLPGLSPG